jgi:hypothetical protein
MKTRTIHDQHDPGRRQASNNATRILAVDPQDRISFLKLFVSRYDQIRAACRGALTPGIVLVSVDSLGGAVGHMSMRARRELPNIAVVGRHGKVDLRLPHDDGVALRHVAVITLPAPAQGERQRVLLLDLNTAQGFEDDRGVRQQAVVTDGPLCFRCGRYAVYMIPSDLARGLPRDATRAWDELPPRVYLEQSPALDPDAAPDLRGARTLPQQPSSPRREVTQVSVVRGPRPMQRTMLERGEQPLGELAVVTRGGGCELIQLGAAAARRGVLVGRYERCATSLIRDGGHERVSRVHLLVIELEGSLYALDTASTNGTSLEGREVRLARLQQGLRLGLGGDEVQVVWQVLN